MSESKDSAQLDLLMHYTSSHMAIFVGMSTAVAAGYVYLEPRYDGYSIILFSLAAFCIFFAGIAIGLIASYIPHFKNFEEIKNSNKVKTKNKVKFPLRLKYGLLEKVENYGFWLGILFSIAAVVFASIEKRDAEKTDKSGTKIVIEVPEGISVKIE